MLKRIQYCVQYESIIYKIRAKCVGKKIINFRVIIASLLKIH